MEDTPLISFERTDDQLSMRFNTETLDFRNSEHLKFQWHEAVKADRPQQVKMDMSNIKFIDSSGLSFLHMVKQNLAEHDGHLELEGLQGQVKTLVELTHFFGTRTSG